MVDIQTVSIAVASAGVFAAAVYYILQIRHQTKIRKIDLATRLVSTFNTKEFAEASFRVQLLEFRDYEDYVKKYGGIPSLNPDTIACRIVSVFFEQIGMLLKRGLVEPDVVFDLFVVDAFWEKMKPLVEGLRKQSNNPKILEWFEYLYNEQKKREQQK